MLTDADVKRLRSICPASRQPDQLSRVLSPVDVDAAPSPAAAGRRFRRDRLFEAMTERERFEGSGVPYDQETP